MRTKKAKKTSVPTPEVVASLEKLVSLAMKESGDGGEVEVLLNHPKGNATYRTAEGDEIALFTAKHTGNSTVNFGVMTHCSDRMLFEIVRFISKNRKDIMEKALLMDVADLLGAGGLPAILRTEKEDAEVRKAGVMTLDKILKG